jgi:hypothetical protein
MKTSYYFSNKIQNKDLNLVRISNSYPTKIVWFQTVRIYKPLCPNWDLIQKYKTNKISKEEYEQIYSKFLNLLDPMEVYADLGENAILLCWERPGVFCHRQIVAKWIYDSLDIKVNEL